MALAGQLPSEAMAKEIVLLKQLATQDQNELAENIKNETEDKKRSQEYLRIALEARHEEEKQQLLDLHARELGELQAKI